MVANVYRLHSSHGGGGPDIVIGGPPAWVSRDRAIEIEGGATAQQQNGETFSKPPTAYLVLPKPRPKTTFHNHVSQPRFTAPYPAIIPTGFDKRSSCCNNAPMLPGGYISSFFFLPPLPLLNNLLVVRERYHALGPT